MHERLFNLFGHLDLPLVVGVTPYMARNIHDIKDHKFYCLEESEKCLSLLRHGLGIGWQLALHGLTHQRAVENLNTEFAGQPYEVQLAKVGKGLSILQRCFPGTRTELFIPPWNSFDKLTIECIARMGFKILCGGDDISPSIDGSGIPIVPSYLSIKQFIDSVLHYSLESLETVCGDSWVVVTLHEYEFSQLDHPDSVLLADFENILRAVVARKISVGTVPLIDDPSIFVPKEEKIFKDRIYMLAKLYGKPGRSLFKGAKLAGLILGDGIKNAALDKAALWAPTLEKPYTFMKKIF
jgi:hypothetical protein